MNQFLLEVAVMNNMEYCENVVKWFGFTQTPIAIVMKRYSASLVDWIKKYKRGGLESTDKIVMPPFCDFLLIATDTVKGMMGKLNLKDFNSRLTA